MAGKRVNRVARIRVGGCVFTVLGGDWVEQRAEIVIIIYTTSYIVILITR